MKRIKKTAQSFNSTGKIFNTQSNSKESTYSCDYINNNISGGGSDNIPMGTIVGYNGDTLPSGWDWYEEKIALPVGLVIMTDTNTNPSNNYEGTWELVDKGFRNEQLSATSEEDIAKYYTADNATSADIRVWRAGNTLKIRGNFTANQKLGEATVNLGTFNLKNLGVSTLRLQEQRFHGGADTGDAVLLLNIDAQGVFNSADAIVKGGASETTANPIFYINVVFVMRFEDMLDEYCDKFYWKRIS